MFPIRDTIQSSTRPYVVYAIIAVNFFAFLYEISLGLLAGGKGELVTALFYSYGIVPALYGDPKLAAEFYGAAPSLADKALPFVTSIFLHGGIMHILGNMWMLWIFGDNVEDRFGHVKFALFYVASGVAAGLTHMFFNLGSAVPTIGASGAIAGVMGAYMVLYPRARVITLIPIFIFIQFVELPAFVFLGFWLFMQFLSTGSGAASSVAWWAHIGGFLFGAAVVFIMGGAKGRPTGQGGYRPPPGRMSGKLDDFWK